MTDTSIFDFRSLEAVEWDDTGSILDVCAPVLEELAGDPDALRGLLATIPRDAHLAGMCEGFDFLRKLVLHDSPEAGFRVRLHLYRPGFFDRPHNHRWSFASRILRGSYTHRLFGGDDRFEEESASAPLRAICERRETAGSTYAIHHSSIHTVQAVADTISLLVRGPAAKDRFLIVDNLTKSSFYAYGADGETRQQRAAKRLTNRELTETLMEVERLLDDDARSTERGTD